MNFAKNFFYITGWIALVGMLLTNLSSCGPQSRKLSRLTGVPVTLKLPEDCVRVISVSVAPEAKGGSSVKNLTYINTDGQLITREYTDWGILEGSVKWVRHDGSAYTSAGKVTP